MLRFVPKRRYNNVKTDHLEHLIDMDFHLFYWYYCFQVLCIFAFPFKCLHGTTYFTFIKWYLEDLKYLKQLDMETRIYYQLIGLVQEQLSISYNPCKFLWNFQMTIPPA